MRRWFWLVLAIATVALAGWMFRWEYFTRHMGNTVAEIRRANRFTGEVQYWNSGSGWIPENP